VQETNDPKEDDVSIMGNSVICTSGLVLVEQQSLDSHCGFGKRLEGEMGGVGGGRYGILVKEIC
jgi:hypothetical protein